MPSLREELPLTQCELKRQSSIRWNVICGNNLAFPKVVWCSNTNSNPLCLAKLHKVMLRSRKALNESCTEFYGSDHRLQNVHEVGHLTSVSDLSWRHTENRQEHWRVNCTLMIVFLYIFCWFVYEFYLELDIFHMVVINLHHTVKVLWGVKI